MEVRFSPKLEAKLSRLAADAGRDTEEYVRDLVERYVENDDLFREAVRQGFASLDRGDFIEEEAMDARVARLLRP